MTIEENSVGTASVGELLQEDLRIPHYQRPYSWEPGTALQLLDDIRSASAQQDPEGTASYVLGAVILHNNGGGFDIVDGQQRLLTLQMLLGLLDADQVQPDPADGSPVGLVRNEFARRLRGWSVPERSALASFIREKCELVRVETGDEDEAFRVFDSQNYRGKPLAPHDLLKAYHLREMRGDSDHMRTAVVEAWESANDDDLDRLFSIFLYRIARWSRGQSAPGFTTQDIGMFKGVSPARAVAPSARYHLAAQSAIPMLVGWHPATSPDEQREMGRARFQLDAPVASGRGFFEMVAFMLNELQALRRDGFQKDGWEAFSSFRPPSGELQSGDDPRSGLDPKPGASRYRYVSELYLAALLYYTNKFGDEDGQDGQAAETEVDGGYLCGSRARGVQGNGCRGEDGQ